MKKLQKERKKTEKPAPPVIPTPQQKEKEFLDHLGTQINNIMHCDEPDWDEIDRQIAENKQREAELASYENTRDHSAESIHCSKLRNPPFVGGLQPGFSLRSGFSHSRLRSSPTWLHFSSAWVRFPS